MAKGMFTSEQAVKYLLTPTFANSSLVLVPLTKTDEAEVPINGRVFLELLLGFFVLV